VPASSRGLRSSAYGPTTRSQVVRRCGLIADTLASMQERCRLSDCPTARQTIGRAGALRGVRHDGLAGYRCVMDTLELDGVRLAYWEEGSGQPVVFVHGVGTSGELWARDLAPLAEDCRLIVYDRRGYGASSESPRDWRAHRDDAIALIDALRAAPAVLVGYSGGSITALDLTLERPDMVTSLVLLDPAFNLRRCLTPRFVMALARAQLLRRVRGERRGAEHWMRYVASYSTCSLTSTCR
jgi:hypothetical protein